jgi:serine/threonine protein kinase, bacterial
MASAGPDNDHERTVIVRVPGQSTLAPGTKILNNTYVIDACIGQGGMGEVYKAEHIELGDKRAIKIIIPEFAQDPQYVSLFIEEARKLSKVNSDAIVRYYEFSKDESGARYLVMEFVDGDPLGRILRARRFDHPEILRLLERVGYGLTAAYDQGIQAHRDLSPSNVLLPKGSVDLAKVIDFGIAKAAAGKDPTALSGGAGKDNYKSPEQDGLFGGSAEVDQRSDIYSLGLCLAAASMGREIDMGSDLASRYIARQSVPDLSDVPPKLRPLIGWMLEPNPERRPQTMRALLEEVELMTAVPTRLAPVGARPAQAAPAGPVAASAPRPAAAPSAPRAAAPAAPTVAPPPPPPPPQPAAPVAAAAPRAVAAAPAASGGGSRALLFAGVGAVAAIAVGVGAFFALRPSAPTAPRAEAPATPKPPAEAPAPKPQAEAPAPKPAEDPMAKMRAEVTNTIQPFVPAAGSGGPALTLASAGNTARIGAPLALDIHAPPFDGYAYIDYYTAGGEVLHLFPNDKDSFNFRPARNEFVLGKPPQVGMQRCWTLSGEAGQQVVTYVAATTPLFVQPRPPRENAQEYLVALKKAMDGVRGGQKTATVLNFDLQAAADKVTGEPACPSLTR